MFRNLKTVPARYNSLRDAAALVILAVTLSITHDSEVFWALFIATSLAVIAIVDKSRQRPV